MKKLVRRLLPLLLAAVLSAGAVPAWAAGSVPDPGPTPETLNQKVLMDRYDGNPITITNIDADSLAGGQVSGFSDVAVTDYFADAVKWAVEEGVTQGTGGGAFSPDATVTRAEAVTFLWRAAGSPAPTAATSGFSDVTDQSAYYYKAVLWAVEQDITQGVGGGRFNLTGTLAYDQILTFLCRAAGGEATGESWSSDALAWARENGLTDGLTFTAKAACPRRDVVYCLWSYDANGGTLGAEPSQEEQQDPEKQEVPKDVPVGLSGEQGARAAIINGLVEHHYSLDMEPYHLTADEVEALAREVTDIDGENPFDVYDIIPGDKVLVILYWTEDLKESAVSSGQILSEEAKAEAQRVVDQVVTGDMSDYDIAKALHDYLVLNCKYDMRLYSGDMPDVSYTANGALLEGTAVCAGYAKAYEALMDAAGIPCEYVSGYATGNHAWNVVEIDGEWYHVDTTWDDPTPDREGYVRYDYFLKSDDYMRQNLHTRWTSDRTCTSTKYDDADLPDTEEQIKQEQQEQQKQQEQAKKQEILNALRPVFRDAIEGRPYQTQAELQAADLTDLEAAQTFEVSFAGTGYTSDDVDDVIEELEAELAGSYSDLKLTGILYRKNSVEFRRLDVEQELQRRQDLQEQADEAQKNADVQALRALLEETIVNMDSSYQELSVSYSDQVIKQACSEMCTVGYSFGGYTFRLPRDESDYIVSFKSRGVVSITNNKWTDGEIEKYAALIEEAIDSGASQVGLPPYEGESNATYASDAYRLVGADGYCTPGGKVAGKDYTLRWVGTDATSRISTVSITYTAQAGMTEEEAMDFYIEKLQAAIEQGDTEVTLPTRFGDNDYSNILNTACETVREKTGYGVYVTAGSVATGDSTVTITPPKKR